MISFRMPAADNGAEDNTDFVSLQSLLGIQIQMVMASETMEINSAMVSLNPTIRIMIIGE